MDAKKRFVIRNQPEPLVPLWEAWIEGHWRPWCLRFLYMCQPDSADNTFVTTLRRDVRLHAFNFSDKAVNTLRANNFMESLWCARGQNTSQDAPPAWWPKNSSAMLKAIKGEREEVDALGYARSTAQQA